MSMTDVAPGMAGAGADVATRGEADAALGMAGAGADVSTHGGRTGTTD